MSKIRFECLCYCQGNHFPLNATVFLEIDIFYFCCRSKDTIFVKSEQKS